MRASQRRIAEQVRNYVRSEASHVTSEELESSVDIRILWFRQNGKSIHTTGSVFWRNPPLPGRGPHPEEPSSDLCNIRGPVLLEHTKSMEYLGFRLVKHALSMPKHSLQQRCAT